MASQPSITFWCGRSSEPWGPPSLNTTGIGGSETAVVHIARLFARAGWRVDVIGSFDYLEGVYEGVAYVEPKRLGATPKTDVLVVWRDPQGWRLPIEAKVRVAWLHDYLYGPNVGADLARFDRVLGVSQWHADLLASAYSLTNTDFVPNGIELARFDKPEVKKVPFQCVWSSSPDRGLDLLLALWPKILAVEPAATLQAAYGWQGIDQRIRMGDEGALRFKDHVMRTIDGLPSVTWHDRLSQDKLAEIKCQSWMAPYMTEFGEVSCISMMENMAAGAVPVTSATGALKETVGDGGYVIHGSPYSTTTHDFFLRICHAVLGEANARRVKEVSGRERAKLLTWEASFARWQRIVHQMLGATYPESLEPVAVHKGEVLEASVSSTSL